MCDLEKNFENTDNDYEYAMTAHEVLTFVRKVYGFFVELGVQGEPVGQMLLDLEEKIDFLMQGDEAQMEGVPV
jgi:hypothetical protein